MQTPPATPPTTSPATPPPDKLPTLPLDRSVGYQVRMTHRLVQRALQVRIERHGVSLGMWYFLRVLWSEDGITQSDLSSLIGTMEPTTLSAVASMEQAGLVRREPHATDRRKVNVFLTDKGRALQTELLPDAIAIVGIAVASFSDREVDLMLALLKVMQANLLAELGEAIPTAKRARARAAADDRRSRLNKDENDGSPPHRTPAA